MAHLLKVTGDTAGGGFDHELTAANPAWTWGVFEGMSALRYVPTAASTLGKSPVGNLAATAWQIVLWLTAYPTATKAIINPLDSGGNSPWRLRINASGQLIVDDSGNTARGTSSAVPLNQWVRVEILANTSGVQIRIYDSPTSMTLVGSPVATTAGTYGTMDNIRLGQTTGSPFLPESYWRILVTDDTDWLGPAQPYIPPIEGAKYGIIGDSLTAMSGANGSFLYDALEDAGIPPRNVYLWGVGGKRITVADLTGRTSALNIEDAGRLLGTIDTWIVALGTNDRPHGDTTVNGDIDTILSNIGPTARVIWIGLTSKGSANSNDIRLNGLIQEKLATRPNSEFADWDQFIRAIDGGIDPSPYWLTSDTTHMTPAGYTIRASYYVSFIAPTPNGYRFVSWNGSTETNLTAVEWDGITENVLTLEESP